ncbi:MAG: hypothetical protein WCY88_14290 [Spongiibacteraceae bacterium]
MKRSDLYRILFILVILTPLIAMQTGPGVGPDWLNNKIGGIPITVISVVLWFAVMMISAVVFGRKQVGDSSDTAEDK